MGWDKNLKIILYSCVVKTANGASLFYRTKYCVIFMIMIGPLNHLKVFILRLRSEVHIFMQENSSPGLE